MHVGVFISVPSPVSLCVWWLRGQSCSLLSSAGPPLLTTLASCSLAEALVESTVSA